MIMVVDLLFFNNDFLLIISQIIKYIYIYIYLCIFYYNCDICDNIISRIIITVKKKERKRIIKRNQQQ